MHWTDNFFPISSTNSKNMHTHSKVWTVLHDEITEQNQNIKKVKSNAQVQQQLVAGFLLKPFRMTEVQKDSQEQSLEALQSPPLATMFPSPLPLLAIADYMVKLLESMGSKWGENLNIIVAKFIILTRKF